MNKSTLNVAYAISNFLNYNILCIYSDNKEIPALKQVYSAEVNRTKYLNDILQIKYNHSTSLLSRFFI